MVIWQEITHLLLPAIFVLILVIGQLHQVKVFETFVEGAGEGFKTILNILPYLITMMVAIKLVQASGILEYFSLFCGMIFNLFHMDIPSAVVPLLILRPLSGSASLAYISAIFKTAGPDSPAGLMASTIMGSTETTFYIASVYFGAAGIKDPAYSIKVGLIADFTGFFAAVIITGFLLG